MIYEIENSCLKIKVNSFGAELVSVYNKKNGSEYMWQPDAEIWDRQSPNMFPVCGRFYGLKYIYKGKTYEMGLHGFGWISEFEKVCVEDSKITLTLTENKETLSQYPFCFEYSVEYLLCENTVFVNYRVKNTGEGSMYFSLGSHPGFNVPLEEGESFEDYYIDFGEKCSPSIIRNFHDNSGFEPYSLEEGRKIKLTHSLFDEDGVFLKDTSGFAALRSTKSDRAVEVRYNDFKYVGIWHAPFTKAPYVCIECWHSLPCSNGRVPDIEKDIDMICLDKNKNYSKSFWVTIK